MSLIDYPKRGKIFAERNFWERNFLKRNFRELATLTRQSFHMQKWSLIIQRLIKREKNSWNLPISQHFFRKICYFWPNLGQCALTFFQSVQWHTLTLFSEIVLVFFRDWVSQSLNSWVFYVLVPWLEKAGETND